MNKECRLVTQEEFELIVKTLCDGYIDDGIIRKKNEQMAVILTCEANLGCRLNDILSLKLESFKTYENRVMINIIEQKTKKTRFFTCSMVFYNFLLDYCMRNNITNKKQRIFTIHDRGVQKNLRQVCRYLERTNQITNGDMIGTHSFRKKMATDLYFRSGKNVAVVTKILQHSSTSVTLQYIKMNEKELEELLINNTNIPSFT